MKHDQAERRRQYEAIRDHVEFLKTLTHNRVFPRAVELAEAVKTYAYALAEADDRTIKKMTLRAKRQPYARRMAS
jgi:hypothetical protein